MRALKRGSLLVLATTSWCFLLPLQWHARGAEAPIGGLRPRVTGVSYVEEDDVAEFQHVDVSGASLVHTWLRWSEVAPAKEPSNRGIPVSPADPNYDWNAIDNWVKGAVEAGLTPLLQNDEAPEWAQGCVAEGVALKSSPCST